MRKLEALKIKRVQSEEKRKQMCFVNEKLISVLTIFSLFTFFCISKMISQA
jgi:hypothetical protein